MGHPLFKVVLDEWRELHDRKNDQYAREEFPLENFDRMAHYCRPLLENAIPLEHHRLACILMLRAKQDIGVMDMVGHSKEGCCEEVEDKLSDSGIYSGLGVVVERENKDDDFAPGCTALKPFPEPTGYSHIREAPLDFTYLASPYSASGDSIVALMQANHSLTVRQARAAVEKSRFELAAHAAAILIDRGERIFCPITHSHPIATSPSYVRSEDEHGRWMRQIATSPSYVRSEDEHGRWMRQDEPFLESCSKLMVLCLPDWEKSTGVKHEMDVAERRGIPIEFVRFDDDGELVEGVPVDEAVKAMGKEPDERIHRLDTNA